MGASMGVGVGVTVGAGVAVGLGARVGTDVGIAIGTGVGNNVVMATAVGGLGVGIETVGVGVGKAKSCRGAGCVGGSAGVRSRMDAMGLEGVAVAGGGLVEDALQAAMVIHTKDRSRATENTRRRKIRTRPHAPNQRRPAISSARIYSCPCRRATTRRLRIPPYQDVAGLISVI